MAKGIIGKRIPKMSEIVKIDGKNVIDVDGDVFDRGLVEFVKKNGFEGYEVISLEDFNGPPKQSRKSKNQ